MSGRTAVREPNGKRVLMLLENYPYPQDQRVCSEAATLRDAGYRVAVIAPRRRGQPRRQTVDGVEVYRYAAPATANSLAAYLLEYGYATIAMLALSLRIAVARGVDVVHAHNPPDTLVFVAAVHKLLGARFVYDHHDLAPEMYVARFGHRARPRVRRALTIFERLSCRLADHVVTTNESHRAVEIERDGVPPDRITVVRNGPSLERLRPVTPDPAVRARARTIIGYAGTMGYQDGVDHLVRALHHLVHELGHSDILCILAGDGDAHDELRSLASELRIDPHTWFVGFVGDVDLVRYLCSADVCVTPDPSSPYNDRATTIKTMEYMALGKPVVAFDLPENRATAGAAAVYVRPNDDRAFAQALADLIDDPERRAALGALGRRRVEQALAWPHWAPRLLEAYETVTAKGKRR